MNASRFAAAALIPLAVAALAACSSTPKADPADLAAKAEEALAKQVGSRPKIDCGKDKIVIEQGKKIVCALTAPNEPTPVYDVTMTITELKDDGTYNFDIKVADKPRS